MMVTPQTEGIKYAGSKLKLLPHILTMASQLQDVTSVLDGFSGSTRVSQAFAQLGYELTSNDVSAWSEVFATCYLKANGTTTYYQEMIDHLNSLQGREGWYTDNYGGTLDNPKKPFQIHNTLKLDVIREEIERMNLNTEDKCVVLTSLIRALDQVDNTMGHYVAYLSRWSARSYKTMHLQVPKLFIGEKHHSVVRNDVFNTAQDRDYDLAYFDPPYGSNNDKMPPSRVRYSAYYHIWTTIVLNDRPALFGKANRRDDTHDESASSIFEEFRKDENGDFMAMNALEKLIQLTRTKNIILSYSSGGRTSKDQLMSIIEKSGQLKEIKQIDYQKNVMSNMRSTNEWINTDSKHLEYLFLIKK